VFLASTRQEDESLATPGMSNGALELPMHASSGPVENVALLTCVLRQKESRVRRWRPHTALLPPDSLSRRLGSCHVEGGADRRALPLDASTGHRSDVARLLGEPEEPVAGRR
jgi:hypothetical protein